ncbi:hypothetical protein DAETH_32410 (plasmid) [Deinococcus aetherius]|uniref:Uncharacterized protein n=1 Tax=Deinococcus aetherius TaxID=200252 RepID=A0ABN6RIS6_9DEIO|nr:hypothetical protein DAETH_32410 [Deinococcus aetherius]
MSVKIRESSVEVEEFLSPPSPLKAELTAFLLPCPAMRLLDQIVAAGRGHDPDVLHSVEHGEFPQGRPVTPQLVGVNDLWDVVLAQQADEKGPRRPGISVFLEEDVQHVPTFVDRPPQPVMDSADLAAHLVQMPPGTPAGFSVAQFLGEEGSEFDVPLPQGLVTDHDAAPLQQLLDITLAEGEAVREPEGVADDAEGKTVAVGLPVSHSSPPYRR